MKMSNLFLLAATVLLAGIASAQERAITEKITVKANVDDVWKAWTTTEGIKSFFAPDAKVELKVDGPFQVYINPFAEPGMKGADDMKIIGFQEKKMLSFTWNAPPSLPEARKQRTVVIVRLISRGDALTDVTLHHVGWGDGGEWDKAYDYLSKAWPNVLKNLQKRFDSGPVDWKNWLDMLRPKSAPGVVEKK
ncbi:MAG: SRPBCC domain-containing protein [Betaproteobacteria bacterium]|nr:SRPBCC domain-containing protein [Betaproteobacteria bacterium]